MNTRLKQFMAAENITQAQLADNLKVVRASVSHILSGRNNPSYEFIKALMSSYPRLNMEWLMFGKGKMYKEIQSQPVPQPYESPDSLFIDSNQEQTPDSVEYLQPEDVPQANTASTGGSDIEIQQVQLPVNQRKVVKITILFDDGTYQELQR